MYKKIYLIFTWFGAGACGQSQQCDSCDEDQDLGAELVPDLPCAGADLETEDLNCGSCGNECIIGRLLLRDLIEGTG